MAISKKTSLIKKLKSEGIPTFGNPSVAELENRLKNWKPGRGWLVRKLHQKKLPDGLKLPQADAIWIPNSDLAHKLMCTGVIVLLARTLEPPKGAVVLGA